MAGQLSEKILRLAIWSFFTTGLFFFWQAILPEKVGVFLIGSATIAFYQTGALGFVPVAGKRRLEERLVRTSVIAGTNFLLTILAGMVFLGISLVFYIAGLSDPDNATFLFTISVGLVILLFLLFWPVLASAFFLDWPTDVSSMYLAWQNRHLHPGLYRAFRVATGEGVFIKWGIIGSLCGIGQWLSLFYVCGMFQNGNIVPDIFPRLMVLLLILPALSGTLLCMAYAAFSKILPKYVLQPEALVPPPTPQEREEELNRQREELERLRARPIMVAYENRLGVEFYPTSIEKPIGLFEGDTRSSVGQRLSAAEALSYRWVEHLEKADAEWFIPILQDLAQGKAIDDRFVEKIKREVSKRQRQIKLYGYP